MQVYSTRNRARFHQNELIVNVKRSLQWRDSNPGCESSASAHSSILTFSYCEANTIDKVGLSIFLRSNLFQFCLQSFALRRRRRPPSDRRSSRRRRLRANLRRRHQTTRRPTKTSLVKTTHLALRRQVVAHDAGRSREKRRKGHREYDERRRSDQYVDF